MSSFREIVFAYNLSRRCVAAGTTEQLQVNRNKCWQQGEAGMSGREERSLIHGLELQVTLSGHLTLAASSHPSQNILACCHDMSEQTVFKPVAF